MRYALKVRTMNRRTSLASLLLVVPVFLVVASMTTQIKNKNVASSGAEMSISPSTVSVGIDQTFETNINISNVSDLFGWQLRLSYNTSLLELVNIIEGSFLNSSRDTYFVPKNVSTDGYVLAGCTSLRNVAGVNGNGTLATVEFRAKTLGSCTLDLYETKLVDSNRQLVEHSETDGSVAVSGCIVVTAQYADGGPRIGADVWIQTLNYFIGRTGEDGKATRYDHGLPDGDYWVYALYPPPGTYFGPTSFLRIINGSGSTTITNYDLEITPPAINVLSPQNQTYDGRLVPLNFTIYDYSPISWMGYSLDGQANTTVTGNVTLNVGAGSHNVVVYANDTYGNMGSSNVVYFSSLGGCVVIRVQYLDGYPRSGAEIRKEPPPILDLGITNESGLMTSCGDLSPGSYVVKAYYPPGTQFGPNTDLDVDGNGDGISTIIKNWEITQPVISLVSPQNLTYYNSSVPLTFTVYDYSSVFWMGYSLDSQANITIVGNITLAVLDRSHQIVVYANDTFGNMGYSDMVYFAVDTTVHDVAVVNVTLSKNIVEQGYSMIINVTVENHGDNNEAFNMTIYGNTIIFATFRGLTLPAHDSMTISVALDTAWFVQGNYTISAYAWPVPGETDVADNTLIDGTVQIIPSEGGCGSVRFHPCLY